MSVSDIVRADPYELERWAKDWLKTQAENLRAARGNRQQAEATFNAIMSDIESLLALVVVTMVKDEYQQFVADFIDALQELRASLSGPAGMAPTGVPPGMPPGMPPAGYTGGP